MPMSKKRRREKRAGMNKWAKKAGEQGHLDETMFNINFDVKRGNPLEKTVKYPERES